MLFIVLLHFRINFDTEISSIVRRNDKTVLLFCSDALKWPTVCLTTVLSKKNHGVGCVFVWFRVTLYYHSSFILSVGRSFATIQHDSSLSQCPLTGSVCSSAFIKHRGLKDVPRRPWTSRWSRPHERGGGGLRRHLSPACNAVLKTPSFMNQQAPPHRKEQSHCHKVLGMPSPLTSTLQWHFSRLWLWHLRACADHVTCLRVFLVRVAFCHFLQMMMVFGWTPKGLVIVLFNGPVILINLFNIKLNFMLQRCQLLWQKIA